MSWYEVPEPVEVVDRLLWRDAQRLFTRHAEPDADNRCGWCGGRWPCPPRRLAERADAAARRSARESWTAPYEMTDLPRLPDWFAEQAAGSPEQPAWKPDPPAYYRPEPVPDTVEQLWSDQQEYASHPR